MTTVMDPGAEIRFEGFGDGTELWGGTQADFVLLRHGRPDKETAIILNNPAAATLAAATGRPDTPEFRAQAARVAGEAWLQPIVAAGRNPDSLIFLSKATFDREPAILASVTAALALPAANEPHPEPVEEHGIDAPGH